MNLPCLRCGGDYEQQRRRASHFCPTCRADINREKTAARMRDMRARVRDIVLDATIAENDEQQDRDAYYADLMGSAMRDTIYARAVDVADTIDDNGLWPLVPDRMPTGHTSPRGPDDGTSTNYTDLAEWLDQHAREVSKHEWFIDSPHWSYELHDPTEASRYLEAA